MADETKQQETTEKSTNGKLAETYDDLGIKPVNIKGKPYILVSDRVKHAHAENDKLTITTELVPDTGEDVVIKATVVTAKGTFTGYSYANKSKTIEKMSPYEVAETSAVGRALGFAGYGLVDSIASADEMIKAGVGNEDSLESLAKITNPETAKKAFWSKFYTLKDYEQANKIVELLDKSVVPQGDKYTIRKKILEKRDSLARTDLAKVAGVELPPDPTIPF